MPMMRNARGGHFSMSAEDRKGAGKRLMGYVLRHHRIRIAVVIVGILLSSYATVAGSMFIKDLIDVYIEPMLLSSQPDFGPLLSAILKMASIYLVGILAALLYNRTMVSISQGVLRDIRQEMFRALWKVQYGLQVDYLRGSSRNGRIQLGQPLQISCFKIFHFILPKIPPIYRPTTSPISYIPASFPARYFPASTAPLAKTLMEYAVWVNSITSSVPAKITS